VIVTFCDFCDFCDFSVVSPCEALRLCRGEVHLQSTTTLSGGGVAGAGLAWHGLASCVIYRASEGNRISA